MDEEPVDRLAGPGWSGRLHPGVGDRGLSRFLRVGSTRWEYPSRACPLRTACGAGTGSGAVWDSLRPPAVETPVRGREEDLAWLWRLARRPAGRFAVVCGPGGTGKTTLAAELAQRAQRSGMTVWWVRWRDPESLVAQLTQACEISAEELQAARTAGHSIPDLVWSNLARRRSG